MENNTKKKKPKDVIGPLLRKDEKIIWCGRPEPEKDEMRLTIIETIAITALAAVMASGIVVKCNGWLVLAFCAAAIIHTVYMVLWGTVFPARRNKIFENIVYGMTDGRLIICDEKDGAIRECHYSDMSEPVIENRYGAVGTIVFDNKNAGKKIKETDLLNKNLLKNVAPVETVLADFRRCMGKSPLSAESNSKGSKKSRKK